MILLDTHSLIWWVSGDQGSLSKNAASAIAAELQGGKIAISAIVKQIEAVTFIPVDAEIAVQAVALPGDLHKDPADRLIVATARNLAIPIVTADEKITFYPHVRTIW